MKSRQINEKGVTMMDLQLEPLISAEKLQTRVKEIGAELTKKFGGKDFIAICVLRGSFVFYSDLIRTIDSDVICEFYGVSSYKDMKSSGEVKLTLDLATPIQGKDVVLVEDIIDSGLTMNYLQQNLLARGPKSLTTVTLLHKPAAKKVDCDIDIVGFEISNEFVVGYGLDYQGFYRNLPYIAQVQNFN